MEGESFDAAVRRLDRGRSRRGVLGGLLGIAAGLGLAAGPAPDDAAAAARPSVDRRRGKGKRCLKNGKPCGGKNESCRKCCSKASEPRPGGGGRRCAKTCGNGGPCTVFVTSISRFGNFGEEIGGLREADATCQRLAGDESLPGTYKAWLSDSARSARQRLKQSTGEYRLVDGTVVAGNWAELTSGTLRAAIDRTEQNVLADDPISAWTGTLTDGSGAANTCLNWTDGGSRGNAATFGDTTSSGSTWTEAGTAGCENNRRFYCIQQTS